MASVPDVASKVFHYKHRNPQTLSIRRSTGSKVRTETSTFTLKSGRFGLFEGCARKEKRRESLTSIRGRNAWGKGKVATLSFCVSNSNPAASQYLIKEVHEAFT